MPSFYTSVVMRTPRLTALRKKLSPDGMSRTNEIIAHRLLEAIKANIDAEGVWEGKWAPRKPATDYAIKYRGGPDKMLAGLKDKFDLTWGTTRATVFSKDKLVKFHHFGTKGGYYITARDPEGNLYFPLPTGRIRVPGGARYFYDMQIQNPHPGVPARRIFPPHEVIRAISLDVVNEELK